jgi:hypothetical protein
VNAKLPEETTTALVTGAGVEPSSPAVLGAVQNAPGYVGQDEPESACAVTAGTITPARVSAAPNPKPSHLIFIIATPRPSPRLATTP